MELEASSGRQQDRKAAMDRVQQIVADEQPFIYLVYPNVLQAVSPRLSGVQQSILSPGPVSSIEFVRRQETSR